MCSNVHGLSSGFGAWRCISWWGWGQINAYIGHICFFLRYLTTHTQDAPPTNRWLNPLSGKNLQRLQTLEGWRPKCSIPNPSYYTNYCAPHLILTCGVSHMPLWVIVLLNSSSQAVMGPNLKFNIYKLWNGNRIHMHDCFFLRLILRSNLTMHCSRSLPKKARHTKYHKFCIFFFCQTSPAITCSSTFGLGQASAACFAETILKQFRDGQVIDGTTGEGIHMLNC